MLPADGLAGNVIVNAVLAWLAISWSLFTGDGRSLQIVNSNRSGGISTFMGNLKAPTAVLNSQAFGSISNNNQLNRYNYIEQNMHLTPYGGGKGRGYNGKYVSWIQWGDYCYKIQYDLEDDFTYDFGAWSHAKLEAWHKDYLDSIGSETYGVYAS